MRFTGHFNPTFHPDRLGEPAKVRKPSIIFADSMSDFWSNGIKDEWRKQAYEAMENCPQHVFMILTKRPERIDTENIPKNAWVGVSITGFNDMRKASTLVAKGLDKTFVSIEPMLEDDILCGLRDIFMADWIIIGAETGRKNAFKPSKESIKEIIKLARSCGVPVFIKNNIEWRVKHQHFPEELEKVRG
jgi:protein gp37